MKLTIQLFVPNTNNIGELKVDREVTTITAALIEAEIVLQAPNPVERSMLRIQDADPKSQSATIFVAYVRDGAWQPYCYPMHFGT